MLIITCRLWVIYVREDNYSMYRLWLLGLYGPRCPLSPKRPINLTSLSHMHIACLIREPVSGVGVPPGILSLFSRARFNHTSHGNAQNLAFHFVPMSGGLVYDIFFFLSGHLHRLMKRRLQWNYPAQKCPLWHQVTRAWHAGWRLSRGNPWGTIHKCRTIARRCSRSDWG